MTFGENYIERGEEKVNRLERDLLYLGWFLLFFTSILNISLLVCYHQDREQLKKQKQQLEIENTDLKNRLWYCDQMSYVIENKCGGN